MAYQLPSTVLGTCSRMPLSPSVMCSACRVRSVTAESRRGICRTTSGARPRGHCAMGAFRPQRTPLTDSQHQLSRRPCTSRVQLEEELKLRTRPEEAYAENLVRLTFRTRMLDFMQVQFSSDTPDEVLRRYRAQHRCHVLRSLKLSTVRSCVGRTRLAKSCGSRDGSLSWNLSRVK